MVVVAQDIDSHQKRCQGTEKDTEIVELRKCQKRREDHQKKAQVAQINANDQIKPLGLYKFILDIVVDTQLNRRQAGKGIVFMSCKFYRKLFSLEILRKLDKVLHLGKHQALFDKIVSKGIDELAIQIHLDGGQD